MQTLRQSGALWLAEAFWPDAEALFNQLVTSIAWDERIRARKVASFGEPYNYSGTVWPRTPIPEWMQPLLWALSQRLGYTPNNCLANFYPDGRSAMGFHADAVDHLGAGSGIAVLSLGATRTLTFRHNRDRSRVEEYPLVAGSLLAMTQELQQEWKHAVLADAVRETSGERISLTFRALIAQ